MSNARKFINFAATILIATALAKLWSTKGNTAILYANDPVLKIENKDLFTAVGVIEVVVAFGLLLLQKYTAPCLVAIIWLGGNFLIYRFAHMLLGGGAPCPCLGEFLVNKYIPSSLISTGLWGISLAFVFGGLLFLRQVKVKV